MMLPQADQENDTSEQSITIWNSLLRRGTAALRSDRPNLFYPIYVDRETHKILYVGESLALSDSRESVTWPTDVPETAIVCWPMRKNNIEGRWQVGQDTLLKRIAEHRVKGGQYNEQTKQCSIVMLKDKQMEQIGDGLLQIEGIDASGAYNVTQTDAAQTAAQSPRTIWVRDSHDASVYGSTLLSNIIGNQKFSFPKSIYAVRDTLRFFVAKKPNALIIDFFAGSGTTLHAVNLLNAEDDGHRRCIMVTNNEVSAEEAKKLISKGQSPAEEEWTNLGIARHVTWPRTVCSIEGHDINGNPLKGTYIGSDRPMADGFKANAAFFKLGFLDKTSVALGRQFKELLPVLWMKAGAIGPCPSFECDELPQMLVLDKNHFAVLLDETAFTAFAEELKQHPQVETVYIITDYEAGYRSMAEALHDKQCYQLYRSYLDNFRINQGRA